ncbi:MAG: hypothetical protein IJ957_03445 [Rikenellaceae bacterium]|nr:hypothetical protein [Rikenellaceae bacterium]
MRLLRYIAMVAVGLLALACEPKPYIPQPPQGTAEHTVIMYLAGNNNLESYLEDNIRDVISSVDVSTPSDNGRIVIYFRPRPASGDPMLLQVYYDKKLAAVQCDTLRTYPAEMSSSDPETLRKVVADAKVVAPAKEYSMIFGSHATGWFTEECMSRGSLVRPLSIGFSSPNDGSFWKQHGDEITRTFGMDGKITYEGATIDDPGMNITEMARALSGTKFRALIFDACFMASVEAVYDLRNVADYVIASSAEIMGRGMPYDLVLQYLFTSGGTEGNLMKYCSEYMRYYKELASGRKSGTISLIDCSKMEALATAVAKVEQGGLNEVNKYDVQAFELLDESQFFDMEHFYDLAAKDRSAYAAMQNALTDCVLYAGSTPTVFSAFGYGVFEVERSCGLTMNIPSATYALFRSEWLKTAWARRIGRTE